MKKWTMSTNHKNIGILYMIFALWSGIIGSSFSMLIRMELNSSVIVELIMGLYPLL